MHDDDPAAAPPPARLQALLQRIAAEPQHWDFFNALRHVDAAMPRLPRLGSARRPADEPVRLGQPPDMTFAPAALAGVDLADRSGRPRIDVRFFGLFGPNGPLPLHLTAYARERKLHKGDETLARFADLFHHRLLLLFYRAWAQAQPAVSLDRPGQDRFADYIGALIGNGGAEWRGRDAAPDHARLAFAGALSRQVRNADTLAQLLSGYLGMPVRVEQFAGRWMALPERERTRIGGFGVVRRSRRAGGGVRLGVNAVLGGAVFDRQHHIRLHVGPLSLRAFEALLPSGDALPAVQALVNQAIGLEFGWDLRLELDARERPDCRLGRRARLGWTTWLGQPRNGAAPALNLVPNPH